MVDRAGFRVVNADCTVVAEAPRLSPYTEAMGARLGSAVGGPVSVKATRAEGLGAIGRAEGIACLAVALAVALGEEPAPRRGGGVSPRPAGGGRGRGGRSRRAPPQRREGPLAGPP